MKINLIFYLCAVIFFANCALARNEQSRRRRPVVKQENSQENIASLDDQIAADSIASPSSQNVVPPPENYPANFFTGSTQSLKKSRKPPIEQQPALKVHYVTPEPYNPYNLSKYENYPSAYFEYTYLNRSETKKIPPKKKKIESNENDFNYFFPDSKRINAKTPAKASTSTSTTNDNFEKFYQPQSSDGVVKKEVIKNGDELTYHYYYPSEESTHYETNKKSPSTMSSSTTRAPMTSMKKRKKPTTGIEHTSTDSYQFTPVLQRPNEYELSGSEAPQQTYEYKTYKSPTMSPSSTMSPVSTIKMLKPTKKNNFYLPSSTISPTTMKPKIRRPTEHNKSNEYGKTSEYYQNNNYQKNNEYHKNNQYQNPSTEYITEIESPKFITENKKPEHTTENEKFKYTTEVKRPEYTTEIKRPEFTTEIRKPIELHTEKVKTYSISPSVSTVFPQYSSTTTRAPELYKYSTVFPTSSSTISELYIKPSTPVTPKATSSSIDIHADGSEERTVVIKPKVQYTTQENFDEPSETVLYKYVDPQEYYSQNDTEFYYSPSRPTHAPMDAFRTPDYFKELNESTQADMEFYDNFHKSYNYEYFNEQDGKTETSGEDKSDHDIDEDDITDNKKRASKKSMIFAYSPEPRYSHGSMIPVNIQEHEMPPPMTDSDNELTPEASKNQQYFVLYSVDDEKPKKNKKKKPQEPSVVYHHHTHQHEPEYEEENFHHFDSEFDSEFDTELVNTENVRIVDPNVRGGKPIEFTKDDYLRHIKQAVVQYMKGYQKDGTAIPKIKPQKYTEDSDHRPSKGSVSSTVAPFKHTLSPQQYKPMNSLKNLPKNVYTADRLKEAIEDMQDSPPVDLTIKKSKIKPFDLSAIDVGQTYQHVNQFDHSAALKNVEEFDQSHALTGNNKGKLHFSQQTYHDINNLGQSHKHKLSSVNDDSENEGANLFKNYKQFQQGKQSGGNFNHQHSQHNAFASMTYDGNKLPRLVGHGNHDEDDDENKVDETIDAPIQIINGIPVANPYNVDLNTLKYMLGGIAQAEVNDQLKDLDDGQSSHANPSKWKGLSPVGSFTSNNPIYQVYNQQHHQQGYGDFPQQKPKKNTVKNHHSNNQQNKQNFPLLGSLLSLNKLKNASPTANTNLNANSNKQRNNLNNNNALKNSLLQDFSNWSQMSKKQRSELQGSSTNQQNVFVLRPIAGKNKHARDDRKPPPPANISRVREPSRDMKPPPAFRPKKPPPPRF